MRFNVFFICFRGNDLSVVLFGLLLGFPVLGGYNVPFPNRLPRGWGAADRLDETSAPLHELDYVLHRLFVPVTFRFPLLVDRFQFHTEIVPPGQNLQVLGVHGPHGTAHELPESVQIDEPDPLPLSDIPLERLSVPHHS